MLTQSGVKQLLSRYRVRPSRRMGQNFFIDANAAQALLRYCRYAEGDRVLEIGPGLGSITELLLETGARVVAVEKDYRLAKALEERLGAHPNLHLVTGDFLRQDAQALVRNFGEEPGPVRVFGNVPYCVTGPLVDQLIRDRCHYSEVHLTVQKEVAVRWAAGPGGKELAASSYMIQCFAEVEVLHRLSPGVFYPKPEVESVFLRLKLRTQPLVENELLPLWTELVRRSFAQRRKKLLSSLQAVPEPQWTRSVWQEELERAQIDPNARPEVLSLEDFIRLARTIDRACKRLIL